MEYNLPFKICHISVYVANIWGNIIIKISFALIILDKKITDYEDISQSALKNVQTPDRIRILTKRTLRDKDKMIE